MTDGHLHGKYLVERIDGRFDPDSRFFVLDYAKDPFAAIALAAYADACAADHPILAADLRAVLARVVGEYPALELAASGAGAPA